MTVLSASELKKSKELRSKTEKEIEKQTEYTKKRDQVLDNLTPMGKLSDKSIKVDKALRKRRVMIFCDMYNEKLEKEDVKNSKYLKRMFSGEKIDGVTFKQACEKAKKVDIIQAKIVETKKESGIVKVLKCAFGLGKKNTKCPMCKQQLSNRENKRKRHLQKCSEKMQSQQKKTRKTFVKNTTKTIHTSFNDSVRSRYFHDQQYGEKYNGNGLESNRRGALSGGVF